MKALPKEVRELVEKANTAAAAAQKTADEAVAKLKASDEKVERMQLEKRITEEFPNLPGTMDEKVAALKSVQGNEALEKMLKAGEAAVTKTLNAEVGSSKPAGTESAIEKINKLAAELVTKGEAKTQAQAITKVAERHPDLYKQYRQEQRG